MARRRKRLQRRREAEGSIRFCAGELGSALFPHFALRQSAPFPLAGIGQYDPNEQIAVERIHFLGLWGRSMLFVNDSVWGLPRLYGINYENNQGIASITIEHLEIRSRD